MAENDRELSDEELAEAAGGRALERNAMPEEPEPGVLGLEASPAELPPPTTGGRDMRRKIRRHAPPTNWAGGYEGQ